MNNLRLILLAVGAVILVLIYCHAMYKKRREEERYLKKITLSDPKPLPPTLAADDEVTATLPVVDQPITASYQEEVLQDGQIISLMIKAPPDQKFSGKAIAEAALGLGLQFGEMGIFHDYGDGELASARAIFSLADLYEPGVFDLDNAAYSTAGLSVFMRLPSSIEAATAFDRMYDMSRRLATALKGELCQLDGRPLDDAAADRMRSTVA